MGFRSIPRAQFLRHLAEGADGGQSGRWRTETDVATIAGWNPAGGAP